MKAIPLISYCLALFFTATLSAQALHPTVPITQLSKLEGRYNITPKGDSNQTALDWICMMEHRLAWSYYHEHHCYIQVTKTKQNRLVFSLWDGDKIVAKSYLRANIHNGKVRAKRTKIRIFTVVLNVVNSHHASLALTPDGDLLVLEANLGGCGLLVFFPMMCAGERLENLLFERLQNGD